MLAQERAAIIPARAARAGLEDDRSGTAAMLASLVQASLTIAMTIPITTKTTIAPCSQIHVGDISRQGYRPPWAPWCIAGATEPRSCLLP